MTRRNSHLAWHASLRSVELVENRRFAKLELFLPCPILHSTFRECLQDGLQYKVSEFWFPWKPKIARFACTLLSSEHTMYLSRNSVFVLKRMSHSLQFTFGLRRQRGRPFGDDPNKATRPTKPSSISSIPSLLAPRLNAIREPKDYGYASHP